MSATGATAILKNPMTSSRGLVPGRQAPTYGIRCLAKTDPSLRRCPSDECQDGLHQPAWAFHAVGALAIIHVALYAYVAFTGRDFQAGDPIRIFRKPDAPSYS